MLEERSLINRCQICNENIKIRLRMLSRRSQNNGPCTRVYTYSFMYSCVHSKMQLCPQHIPQKVMNIANFGHDSHEKVMNFHILNIVVTLRSSLTYLFSGLRFITEAFRYLFSTFLMLCLVEWCELSDQV